MMIGVEIYRHVVFSFLPLPFNGIHSQSLLCNAFYCIQLRS